MTKPKYDRNYKVDLEFISGGPNNPPLVGVDARTQLRPAPHELIYAPLRKDGKRYFLDFSQAVCISSLYGQRGMYFFKDVYSKRTYQKVFLDKLVDASQDFFKQAIKSGKEKVSGRVEFAAKSVFKYEDDHPRIRVNGVLRVQNGFAKVMRT